MARRKGLRQRLVSVAREYGLPSRVRGEAPQFGTMNGSPVVPWPSPEFRRPVIAEGFPDFIFAVHDEGAVLDHRFLKGAALKEQKAAFPGPVDQGDLPLGGQVGLVVAGQGGGAGGQATPFIEV